MLIFLFIVTSYSLANLYVYFKLSSWADAGTVGAALIGIAVFFMTISPVLIPIYSHKGSERSVRLFSWFGYSWLGLLVPYFATTVIIDLYNMLVSVPVNRGNALVISLLLSVAVYIYGCFESRWIKIDRFTLQSNKLPDGQKRIRIVQISDLHLGAIVRDRLVNKIVPMINDEKPDIIVCTGDLVDGNVNYILHLPEKLRELNAPLGKFAIVGNHEAYGGTKNTDSYIAECGFRLLKSEVVSAKGLINIAGMDFMGAEAATYNKDVKDIPEKEVLESADPERFTVLLKHKTDVEEESLGLFDLQLSGHTHRGQIFPMHLATMFIFKYHSGFTRLPKGSAIHVNRGTGTAGPPVRFLSRPEITVIDIVKG